MSDDERDDDGDLPIFEALRAGNRKLAFRLLQERYVKKIYNIAARAVRDRHLAEDVMQETLLQIHKDFDTVRDPGGLRAWVYKVTNHRSIDAIRRRARQQGRIIDLEQSPEVADASDLPEVIAAFAEDVRGLEDCLAELPVKTRNAVLMRFQEGLSFEDMAKALDEKSDSVRMRVVRALPKLRACIEKKRSRS